MEEKKKKKKWPVVVGVIAVIMVIAAVGGSTEAKKVGTKAGDGGAGTANGTTASAKDKFSVGDVVELNGVQVTLAGVTESAGSQYNTPAEGNVFLVCEFEINNQSSNDITVSSIVSFDAYCDDYSINQSFSAELIGTDSGKKQLDGTVAAGKKMNGVIGYEVPADWKALEISYSPSYWGNKSMTFEALH